MNDAVDLGHGYPHWCDLAHCVVPQGNLAQSSAGSGSIEGPVHLK
ncbi:hypothetical protein SacazDRAFT_03108 [Saccharomonospora azurea NA-128]|uniref:Uncharacterized protein n=1 Tax=Saccharomonospora azurea NA-128 TaxID=882081 RepID=H8GES9_9PSEU|nr:hypothetical protein SacazDRAFT_03108 [Saccharomonospora azurea NA-128]